MVRGPQSQPPPDVPSVDGDPHFIIQVPEKGDAICFNIDEAPGTVLRLIQDPVTGEAWGLGLFLARPGAPVGTRASPHSAHGHPPLNADYILEGAVQRHMLTQPPQGCGVEIVRLRLTCVQRTTFLGTALPGPGGDRSTWLTQACRGQTGVALESWSLHGPLPYGPSSSPAEGELCP